MRSFVRVAHIHKIQKTARTAVSPPSWHRFVIVTRRQVAGRSSALCSADRMRTRTLCELRLETIANVRMSLRLPLTPWTCCEELIKLRRVFEQQPPTGLQVGFFSSSPALTQNRMIEISDIDQDGGRSGKNT